MFWEPILLIALMETGVKSMDELSYHKDKYDIPWPVTSGLQTLIECGILIGDVNRFEVNLNTMKI